MRARRVKQLATGDHAAGFDAADQRLQRREVERAAKREVVSLVAQQLVDGALPDAAERRNRHDQLPREAFLRFESVASEFNPCGLSDQVIVLFIFA